MIVSTVVYARGARERSSLRPSSTARTVASPSAHTRSIASRSRSVRCGAAMAASLLPQTHEGRPCGRPSEPAWCRAALAGELLAPGMGAELAAWLRCAAPARPSTTRRPASVSRTSGPRPARRARARRRRRASRRPRCRGCRWCRRPGGSTGRTAPGGPAPLRGLLRRLGDLGPGEQAAGGDAVVLEGLVVAAAVERGRLGGDVRPSEVLLRSTSRSSPRPGSRPAPWPAAACRRSRRRRRSWRGSATRACRS